MGAIEQVTAAMWPGSPVIPSMSTGATDSKSLRCCRQRPLVPKEPLSSRRAETERIRARRP